MDTPVRLITHESLMTNPLKAVLALTPFSDSDNSRNWIHSVTARLDRVWLLFFAVLLAIGLFAPAIWPETVASVAGNLAHTSIFIAIAVCMLAYLRASGAEALAGKAFQGNQSRMIIVAALVGGLAPFCSCEVIPFIAALLAMGTPLAAVMAFWLASPIMDPPMFAITAGALGFDFAVAKTAAAVGFGLMGGFITYALSSTALFSNSLREQVESGCGSCCGASDPFKGKVEWKFWKESARVETFRTTVIENALFLLKWMALAYLLEALMIRYVPAEWIASALGGEGFRPVLLGTLLGGPAYLNGYAAVPLVQGMLEQGMSQGAAMSFVLAGSVTCIPAAVAVWALVKPRVFFAYIVYALLGSLMAGMLWAAIA